MKLENLFALLLALAAIMWLGQQAWIQLKSWASAALDSPLFIALAILFLLISIAPIVLYLRNR